jgi:ubiquinone biosynthesis protein
MLPLLARSLMGRRPGPAEIGVQLRRAFEVMGLTYIKLGQFLAMRFDLFPEELCAELALLFNDVPPMPPALARRTLLAEFGADPDEIFESFEWTPVAAASIAQVHRAKTRSGEAVAVKVQRHGIAALFAADMRNLARLARIADYSGILGVQSAVEAVREFERFTAQELNFLLEGATADRVRSRAGPNEHVPRIFWPLTTERVLTMELVAGHRLSDILAGRSGELPTDRLDAGARNLARACLRQLFVTGFFHADPHPGNIFLLDDGSVCFIDFGIFGQLPRSRREQLASYIEQVAMGNFDSAYRSFLRILNPTPATDHRGLRRDIGRIFRDWHGTLSDPSAPPADRYLGRYVGEFMAAVRRNRVGMSIDTLLFWRTLITLDATAMQFRDSFDLLETIREFFAEIRPNPLLGSLGRAFAPASAAAALEGCVALPAAAGDLVASAADGRLVLRVTDESDDDRKDGARDSAPAMAAILGLSAVLLLPAAPPGLWALPAAFAALVLLAWPPARVEA